MGVSKRGIRMAGAFALALSVAISVGACSSSSSTAGNNGGNGGNGGKATQAAGANGGNTGGGLAGAASALKSVKSYKFTITMKGGSFGSYFEKPMTGTLVTEPTPAVEISYSMMGMSFGVKQVGDTTYTNILGEWTATDKSSDKDMLDSFSPEKMFGQYLSGDMGAGYKSAGDEQKNGVATTHYVGDASAMNEYGSTLGVKGGTWTAEVWIAKDGGFPVSQRVANTGGDEEFLMQIDITNINDPANKVAAP